MRAPYRWLKELVPALPADPAAISARLTSAGLEVDAIHATGGFDKVVVGVLLERGVHPNNPEMSLCRVSVQEGTERQIVCGAKNHQAGDKVAVALPGAVLPNGMKIEKRKTYGVPSDGMLCSVAELGIGDEADGILILPPESPVGAPVADTMGLSDWVFEIGLTPNRGDCLSILGVARELAAAFGVPLAPPKIDDAGKAGAPSTSRLKVATYDAQGCPHYVARIIDDVTIAPSPRWLAQRLEQCGIRPINNVVDVTNYVMLELGQPLHAFDARNVRGNVINVRPAKSGETMKTLDGVERKLAETDLVIADGQGPVAIAGVMGGEHSGVLPDTKSVVLESAWFDPSRVRRTARAQGLHTDSSHRFERSVDPAGTDRASRRAAALIAELGKGKVVPETVQNTVPGWDGAQPRRVKLTRARVERILGVAIPAVRIAELLNPLELAATVAPDGESLEVSVPRFRGDLSTEIDLVEEVARRHGYENIPETRPRAAMTAEGQDGDVERVRRAKGLMVSMGFHETVHLPFGARDEAQRMKLPDADPRALAVRVANPLADDQAVLRGTLLPALLANLARNRAVKNADVRTFELRSSFRWNPGTTPAERKLPEEGRRLAALLSGRRATAHWDGGKDAVDFFDAKGVVETFLLGFTRKSATFTRSEEPFLVPGAQARVDLAGKHLGSVGEVHPDVLRAFGVDDARAFVLELDFDAASKLTGDVGPVTELPRFPSVDRDVALLVEESVEVGALLAEARKWSKRGLEKVEVFDVFRGGKLPEAKKSVAFGMTWRAPDRTLTDDDVNALQEKLVASLVERFKAEQR